MKGARRTIAVITLCRCIIDHRGSSESGRACLKPRIRRSVLKTDCLDR